MGDLEQLNLAKISELTTGGTDHFREEVEGLDLALKDLRALKEAEKAGKNRGEVLDFLDRQINSENVAAYLGVAENDIGELNDLLNEIDRLEDIDHFDGEKIEIDQDKLIDLVGGTVKEMKEFVKNNSLRPEQLQNVLDAEKKIKDRKTAVKFLERQLKKSRVSEDMSEARDDLENLKKDIEALKEDEASGQMPVSDDKEEKDTEEKEASEEESEEEKNEYDEEDPGNEEEIDNEAPNPEEEQDEAENVDEKRELADELGLDMADEELESFSLKDLKKIRSEKEHREDLIDRLSAEGLDEEDLRNSSTSDLEKVAESIDDDEESQEEHEEMREEAEEDLEMLMGAVRWDEKDDEDSGKNTREKIQDMKQNIKDMLDRGKDKEEKKKTSGINAGRVEEVLDQYRSLDDDEASIKTAHIMKGFLEKSLEIEREMTYKELAETMPTDDESMKDLSDFFLKMHREQYTGKVEVNNADKVIDTCEDVIDRLS